MSKNTFLRSDIETQAKTGDRGRPVGLQEAAYRPEIDALEHCVGSQVIPWILGAIKSGRGFLFVPTDNDRVSVRGRSRVIDSR